MKEIIENYSLIIGIVIVSVVTIIWNIGSHIYYKYFDSDEKRLKRLNEWKY